MKKNNSLSCIPNCSLVLLLLFDKLSCVNDEHRIMEYDRYFPG